MKNRFFTFLGFTVATVGVITYFHLQKRLNVPEVLAGITSAVYFSVIFAAGLFGGIWIFNLRKTPVRPTVLAAITGFNSGLISWLLIYLLWLLPLMNLLKHYVFVINSVLIFCAGVVINKVPIYGSNKNSHQEQKDFFS